MSRSKDTGARDRQAAYRKAQKQARRPDRDDIARVALLWLIKSMEQRSRQIESHAPMNMIMRTLVAKMVEQGFDKYQAEDVLEDLVDKYLDGWEFQRKPHLRAPDTG